MVALGLQDSKDTDEHDRRSEEASSRRNGKSSPRRRLGGSRALRSARVALGLSALDALSIFARSHIGISNLDSKRRRHLLNCSDLRSIRPHANRLAITKGTVEPHREGPVGRNVRQGGAIRSLDESRRSNEPRIVQVTGSYTSGEEPSGLTVFNARTYGSQRLRIESGDIEGDLCCESICYRGFGG